MLPGNIAGTDAFDRGKHRPSIRIIQTLRSSTDSVWPGLALTGAIAASAFALRLLPGVATLGPMILAIAIGIAVRNIAGPPVRVKAGMTFSLKRILRFAIILLGLQLTVRQAVEVGFTGIAIIMATLIGTFAFTKWLGKAIGVDRKLAELIAAGTSICGASAVIVMNTVTEAHDEDVAYAVASVTVFGSLSMFLYPILPALLYLDPHAYGLWTGASIHEIAQVVAAAFQDGKVAGDFGTVAKLSRVMMLAPMVIGLGIAAARRSASDGGTTGPSRRKAPLPWFVLGFMALTVANSFVKIPVEMKAWLMQFTVFLLSMALAALGLETDIRKLRAKGILPLALGAASWLFIAAFSLALVKLFS